MFVFPPMRATCHASWYNHFKIILWRNELRSLSLRNLLHIAIMRGFQKGSKRKYEYHKKAKSIMRFEQTD
jgi:hypothetical protein